MRHNGPQSKDTHRPGALNADVTQLQSKDGIARAGGLAAL
ncbi:hypothetical protein RD1_2949 [Roseobacter denitrificans OCh 114]|uniref:Uncharacterized protein n=1 Tax=Roseobacter denitrificans (strain ATCC 33942 / OCh 114) TaxID=375451 RepID=Q164X3_ROSDO|nr:hypothetical protein RD1_2949 [Roseobacter denitrificans OCh 114]